MSRRELVCVCEDVTRRDVEEALAAGCSDIESIKRYTGLGTGFCQGRSCMTPLARLLAARGVDTRRLAPMTARAPLWPASLGALAALGELPPPYPSAERPALVPSPDLPQASAPLQPLPEATEIVVVGGGIMGLAMAYHLAARGHPHVVVLERSYLSAGASGRNGGGIREQWSTEQNILLMKESLGLCRRFAKDFGVNVWLRQGGYLFVAQDTKTLGELEHNVALQNRLGVPTRILDGAEAQRLVPELHVGDVVGASFNPEDGIIFPWPFLWGYASRAQRLGAHIATFTPVTGIDIEAGQVVAVQTPRGRVRCSLVLNAAAAWAPEVAKLAGVSLPNRPQRHEILVTESLKPFLQPLVSELESGLYFSQSLRGELVGGMGDPDEPWGLEMRSSLRFAVRMARALTHRLPAFADVKVLRQWAGCYDVTPDRNPIIGEVDEVKGFFQLHGFVGHGFMMAPAVCKLVAEHIVTGRSHPFITQNRLRRFREGAAARPESMIIG